MPKTLTCKQLQDILKQLPDDTPVIRAEDGGLFPLNEHEFNCSEVVPLTEESGWNRYCQEEDVHHYNPRDLAGPPQLSLIIGY